MHFWAKVAASLLGIWLILAAIPTGAQCPHRTFVLKHVCAGPATEANALLCSQQRNSNTDLSSTGVNTVFFGTSTYAPNRDNLCINEV